MTACGTSVAPPAAIADARLGLQPPCGAACLTHESAMTACGASVAPSAAVAAARLGLQPHCGAARLTHGSSALTTPAADPSPWPLAVSLERSSGAGSTCALEASRPEPDSPRSQMRQNCITSGRLRRQMRERCKCWSFSSGWRSVMTQLQFHRTIRVQSPRRACQWQLRQQRAA